jgi:hypothetical protein
MAYPERAQESAYERLRADYDAAFARLRREEFWLRSMAQQSSTDKATQDVARRRVDEAMAVYRERRNQLAGFLASFQPAGRSAGSADSQALSVWMMEANRNSSAAHPAEVQALAYRLWEEAGRPLGNPDEQWYRAERLLQDTD